jgi:polysaccharide biosynthesis protein PslG
VNPLGSRRALAAVSLAAAAIAAVVVIVVLIAPGGGSHARGPALTTPRPSATARPVAGEQFGASVNLLFNTGAGSAARRDAQLNALQATGATVARSDALWELSEPSPPVGGTHRYDWTFDDQIAGSLAADRLRWLPIVDYSAPWARSIPGQDHSPPSSSADYAAYAAALAGRFGPGGSFWRTHPQVPALPVEAFEIWNEPDSAYFWTPRADAARYAELYARARDAIHTIDPSARVLVGGLAGAPAFLPRLLTADPGLRGRIDGVAIHPYAGSPAAVLSRVISTRRALERLGLPTVPLYVSEFGWTTSPPGSLGFLPAALRPGYIERTLLGLRNSGCNVAATVLYTWFSPERDPRNSQDWFGISPPGAPGSPDVTAFTDGIRPGHASPVRGPRC